MIHHDCENNVYYDPATGLPPVFATTAGTYQYTLPDDCRKLASVFIAETNRQYESNLTIDAYGDYFYLQGTRYQEVRASSRPKTPNSNAVLTFSFDPGTTTQQYYRKYYLVARDISSSEIELDVPDTYHDLVVDGLIARVRQIQYGENDQYLLWRNERVPKEYWQEMNENPTQDGLMPLRWG